MQLLHKSIRDKNVSIICRIVTKFSKIQQKFLRNSFHVKRLFDELHFAAITNNAGYNYMRPKIKPSRIMNFSSVVNSKYEKTVRSVNSHMHGVHMQEFLAQEDQKPPMSLLFLDNEPPTKFYQCAYCPSAIPVGYFRHFGQHIKQGMSLAHPKWMNESVKAYLDSKQCVNKLKLTPAAECFDRIAPGTWTEVQDALKKQQFCGVPNFKFLFGTIEPAYHTLRYYVIINHDIKELYLGSTVMLMQYRKIVADNNFTSAVANYKDLPETQYCVFGYTDMTKENIVDYFARKCRPEFFLANLLKNRGYVVKNRIMPIQN